MNDKEKTRISRFLSLILRHKPEEADIQLDLNGWTNVRILLNKISYRGYKISMDNLEEIVNTNEKKRFAFNYDKSEIRASQGHSVDIDLNLKEIEPPDILLHGTVNEVLSIIKKDGLNKMSRKHVHLSDNIETAKQVGSRRGKPHILSVSTKEMYDDGYKFYKSDNGVWLTDHVPTKYINFNYNGYTDNFYNS